ncbi:MAG: hypothetical protein P4N41_18220 [Negativicutes bacterium]|nr:hypothetical protein [Negativicutes bacterium]
MGESEFDKLETSQEISLIDILYKDQSRIDSFIAQIAVGALRSVKYTSNTTQGSSSSLKGGVPGVASGGIDAKESTAKSIEKTIEPHDHNVLRLLEFLDLPTITTLPDHAIGKLILIRAQITIRNLKLISDMIPILGANGGTYGIDKKNAKAIGEMIKTMAKMVPMGLEIELVLEDGTYLRGPLKEEFLLESSQDLLRSFGTVLPGYWHVVGVIDNNSQTFNESSNPMRSGVDQFAAAIKLLYSESPLPWVISPILIFRELDK